MPELYIGLMSGTSLDGIDAVLADLGANNARVIAHCHRAFGADLRAELLALSQTGNDELRRAALTANELTRAYAAAVRALLDTNSAARPVTAIGCHGQTVRHRPADGYTTQLMNGALLAELAGIDVVCDFRSRDIAAGGQGAPLVPAFHHAIFSHKDAHRVIVNIGGIANLTDLPPAGAVTGFDCGPGNLLLDAWAQRHLQQPFDRGGAWAASGHVIPSLLGKLLGDPYFRRAPPKSAGRENFNPGWLTDRLMGDEVPADVQATLLALTAQNIAVAIATFCLGAREIFLCGGGARNTALVGLLAIAVGPRTVAVTDALGVNAEHVEAAAFAWLARQTLRSLPGNLPSVTGARDARVLGAIYRT